MNISEKLSNIESILKKRSSKYSKERESLFEYLKYSFRQYKRENWHHRLICEYLQKYVLGEITRLMIFAPPRHMKTESSERALTWALGKNDDCKIIICGYSDSKSRKISMHVRDNIKDNKFKDCFPDRINSTFLKGVDTQNDWQLDKEGRSSVLSAGVSGPITGEGFILGYIDDPYKSREEAESPTIRSKINDWYYDTFITRQDEEYSGILITATRWHSKDINSHILLKEGIKEYNGKTPSEGCPDWNSDDKGDWVVLNLVAIHDEKSIKWKHKEDPRKIGEALWPERFPIEFLMQFKSNSYNWAANYMGCPTGREGNIISRDWIIPVEKMPYDPRFLRFWDLAGTPKDSVKQNDPDYTAGVLVAEKDGSYYIIDIQVIRGTPKEVDDLILRTAKNDLTQYDGRVVQIWEEEGGAGGKHLSSKYKNLLNFCQRKPYRVGKSKEFYIDNLANKAETGDIYFIDGKRWVYHKTDHGTFWDELEEFPKGAHDDRIDAAAKAVHILGEKNKIDINEFYTQSAVMA